MMLAAGSRLGSYEIAAPLGSGGMGEVYRARDTKLNRDVAIKILPDLFVGDPERVARFEREAQLLAALNHPNIATIHGLEEAHGTRFLVLELVPGGTLESRLALLRGERESASADREGAGVGSPRPVRKAGETLASQASHGLPLDEALAIARQIVDALEAAHDKGIIHRDLKPANIALTADGQVKVLDFGLAKALEPEGRSDVANSPTLTLKATQAGIIMGTAAYMSPEQAKGRATDKRSDVWAFGCVLYEMLTGKRAFEGEDVTETIASIVKSEPDWNALPPDVPPHVRTILKRCLQKDRKTRIPEIAVVRYLMDEAGTAPAAVGLAAPPPATARVALIATVALALGSLAGAAAAWWLWPALQERHVTRFSVPLPEGQSLSGTGGTVLSLSPDGSKLVYLANSRLFLRPMDQLEATPVQGSSELPLAPVFSPDAQWVAYWTTGGGGQLKKIAVAGGAPVTLATAITQGPSGVELNWQDSSILVSLGNGIFRVPDTGGTPTPLVKVDVTKDFVHRPQLLPGGKALLFTMASGTRWDDARIVAQVLATGERKILVQGGTDGRYLPTGHLIYARRGVLYAIPFDAERLEPRGGPVSVLQDVSQGGVTGAAHLGTSHAGSLVYVKGAAATAQTLVWLDRSGREEPLPAPARPYRYPRISPDATRVAVDAVDQENDIWIWDLHRQTLTRLTFDPAEDSNAVWTPDGRRVAFGSSRTGALFWKAADGTGVDEPLAKAELRTFPMSFSPDGRFLVYRERGGSSADLAMLDLADRQARPLLKTQFVETNGEVSPDGRWIAYQSNESGQAEVYVRPFPAVDKGRWQVSTAGGVMPAWSRTGRELFYVGSPGEHPRMMVVPIQATDGFAAGAPQPLFDVLPYAGAFGTGRTYDVSPDAKRFLMVKRSSSGAATQLIVIENWFDELRARVPTK